MIDLITDFDSESDKRRLFNVLKSLKGKNVIQIKKFRQKRTVNQNSYLWAVVYRYLGEEIGYTGEEVHQEMGRLFLSYEKTLPNGSAKTFVRSTTDLDTLEMSQYIEKIKDFALEQFSCLIPEASQVNF